MKIVKYTAYGALIGLCIGLVLSFLSDAKLLVAVPKNGSMHSLVAVTPPVQVDVKNLRVTQLYETAFYTQH